MNAEISKIRKIRNNSEIFDYKPTRINEKKMSEAIYELNINFTEMYNLYSHSNVDIDFFVNKFISNIYIVLNMFNEMGIYPDYFYDEIVKMNIEYKKIMDNTNNLRGNYRLFNETRLSAKVSESIKKGLENGHYRYQAYQKKTIDDAFLEMVGFFEIFNIPYNIHTNDQCQKVFGDISFNHASIVETLMNSDYIFVDIECLSRLLFEYLSFFVSIGEYPKKHLDEYINAMENAKRK